MICSFLFVAIPLVIIRKNDKMKKYSFNLIRNSQLFFPLKEAVKLFNGEKNKRSNQVAAVNIITV